MLSCAATLARSVVHPSPGLHHRTATARRPALQQKSIPGAAACACGGECPRCRREAEQHFGLTIGTPGDRFEREADRIADEVMRMPDGNSNALEVASSHESDLAAATAASGALRDNGKPLPSTLRAFFEPRFNRDLGHVRIHTNTEAGASAQAVSAHAYTIGRDIVFAAGKYAPQTNQGRRLLAHELTHVIQQGEVPSSAATLQRQEAMEQAGPASEGGGGAPPAKCGEWGLDKLTKAVAEFYVSNALKMTGQATTVSWTTPPRVAVWDVSTANRMIKVLVDISAMPRSVLALQFGSSGLPSCYSYDCPNATQLTLTPIVC
jgi:Domain of unknown function (DUF4157)